MSQNEFNRRARGVFFQTQFAFENTFCRRPTFGEILSLYLKFAANVIWVVAYRHERRRANDLVVGKISREKVDELQVWWDRF